MMGVGMETDTQQQADARSRIADLEASIATMRGYLLHKFALDDWHGVMDAAADLRELVVRKLVIEDLIGHGRVPASRNSDEVNRDQ